MKNAEPSDRQSVRDECKSNLKEIRDSYRELRTTYQETFKEFRENMRILIQESKGLPVNSAQRDAAISNIESLPDTSEKRDKLRELKQKMSEELREEKKQLREQEKREREELREKHTRSEEHTSDSSHITISYAVFCLKKKMRIPILSLYIYYISS